MNKKVQRLRRATRSRAKIRELKALRLSVHRTSQHIYAQILDTESHVLAAASTVQKALREGVKYTGGFKDGKFDGEGELVYTNGDRFKGLFSGGMRNGKGVFTEKEHSTEQKVTHIKYY